MINKVHLGDWTTNQLEDKSVQLIIADPPYFEVKGEFDFVWDSFDDYLKDVEKWAIECKRVLADNGTLFWYGDSKKIAYAQIIFDKYFNLLNSLVWRKKDSMQYQYYSPDLARSFNTHNERILMYSNDKYNLTKCVYHIRDYIRKEIIKSKDKIILKQVNKALGTATNGGGVASACLSLDKTEPTMITKEMYIKLQKWCEPYLRKEYEELRKEYEELRRFFYNPHKFEEVLEFSQESHITRKYNHDTKKPETLTRALIQTCTRKSDLVLVPFAGSGTECAMAAKEDREFIGFDIEPKYVEMANDRCSEHLKQTSLF
jgi:DNA modification methylase